MWLGGAVVVGCILRLHQIRDQLLLDDEWHTLRAAALTSPRSLLLFVSMGASSIPMNLYCKLLLDGPGWSELALRLPSLLAGVGMLFIFPLLVRDLFRQRTIVLFAYLIALSPFLVFYSRYFRVYSTVALLTFVSLIFAYRWAVSGGFRDAALFVTSGVMVAYIHVTEMRSIFLPLLLFIVLKVFARVRSEESRVRPSVAALAVAGLLSALVLTLLFLPGFLAAEQFLTPVVGLARPGASTLLSATELLSGTSLPLVRGVFVALAVLGLLLCFRHDDLLATLFLVVVIGSIGMVLLVRPLDSEKQLTFTRYVIAIFPVAMITVAIGVDGVLLWAERRSPLAPRSTQMMVRCAAGGALAALFWVGPLPDTYSGRNGFTNHKAFQASYAGLSARTGRRRSFTADHLKNGTAATPPFYDRLVAQQDCDAIIEYPLPIGDRYSPYFLYQAYHQRRVLGGYFHRPSPGADDNQPGVVGGNWIIDQVLDQVTDATKLRFHNLVDLDDSAAVRASRACYLIVHSHPELEARPDGVPRRLSPDPPSDYVRRFGQPVYADALTTVFDLRRSAN